MENGPTTIHSLNSIVDRIEPKEIFSKEHLLEIELGSGDGSFLVEYARRRGDRNFIGVERLLGRLRKMDRKTRRAGLDNLRGIRIESAYFLRYLVPLRSVAALHVYFPDPWPKRRHWERRLVNDAFTETAAKALQSRGVVYLRTDDRAYFQQMTGVFSANKKFIAVPTPDDLLSVKTDFEKGFLARGIATLHAAYQLA